jgi:hypothetical protein
MLEIERMINLKNKNKKSTNQHITKNSHVMNEKSKKEKK